MCGLITAFLIESSEQIGLRRIRYKTGMKSRIAGAGIVEERPCVIGGTAVVSPAGEDLSWGHHLPANRVTKVDYLR